MMAGAVWGDRRLFDPELAVDPVVIIIHKIKHFYE